MNAYEIVMESRQKLVEQVISNMKKGYIFTRKKWDAQVLAPQNPVSHVRYKEEETGYADPARCRKGIPGSTVDDQEASAGTGILYKKR